MQRKYKRSDDEFAIRQEFRKINISAVVYDLPVNEWKDFPFISHLIRD